MYARHKFRRLTGTRTEAELLVKLWTCQMILLRGTPDSLDGVRVLHRRIGCLPKKAALYSTARVVVCSSVRSEHSVFPFTVITPRGPGILSLRYA